MPVGTVSLVSKSEYARMRNCTEGAVRRAVRDGRISLIDGKIDPVAADAQWSRNTRVRMGSVPANESHLAAGQHAGPEREITSSSGDYWTSKAKREQAEAEIAELKLAEMRGELVRAADVRAALSKQIAGLRETLLQLPSRVVPLLVADPAAGTMDRLLRAEIVSALGQLTADA
jgi:phage terminase Nu1 subunit (DNA packaging protein)